MTTTQNADGLIVTTSTYANGRRYATVYIPEMTEDQLMDRLDGFHRDAFRALNADLVLEGKHLEAPLVRVDASTRKPSTQVIFAEYREEAEYGDVDY